MAFDAISSVFLQTFFPRRFPRSQQEAPVLPRPSTGSPNQKLEYWLLEPVHVEVAMTNLLPVADGNPPWMRPGLLPELRPDIGLELLEPSAPVHVDSEEVVAPPPEPEVISFATTPPREPSPREALPVKTKELPSTSNSELSGVRLLIDGWENNRYCSPLPGRDGKK